MRNVDGDRMRWLEAKAREIGKLLKEATKRNGEQHGFCLFVFSFNGPELTYLANADRADVIKMLEEFIARQRSGEANQMWHGRN